ncbi:hypothetical protein H4R20_000101 [Coemansia guatemalensis]|uniref:Mitochondrial carrier n=1 Tax=Coemansia guatemalensis TaxID=2761395 RepID=A0A9W8LWZ1_9FUNG|nr:hypothetical protein H4R20_000101 [Coemansia guatemalensis]
MHTERDHFWLPEGISLQHGRERRADSQKQTRRLYGEDCGEGLGTAMTVEIKPAGDLPESIALSLDAPSYGNCENSGPILVPRPRIEAQGSNTDSSESLAMSGSWPLKNSIAGAGAGCVSSIVTCPLDVVKTRLQYQGVLAEKYQKSGYKPYRGTLCTLQRIVAEEGPRGLYRGLAPMMMGYLPTWGIYFAAYESLKREFSANTWLSVGPTAVHVMSAIGAGASTSLLTNPIWVLKSRFMTQSAFTDYRYTSMWHAVRMIYSAEGLHGFYKGLGSSLLGSTHVAVQFPLYEFLKHWMHVDSEHQLESSRILLASAVSKMVASSATYPHEVIRTRLQNQSAPPYKYKGILHAIRLIYHEEGAAAFYRGLPTNLIRTVPASMMTLLTYELLIRLL